MEPSFWHERWENEQIGFHQGDVNPFLIQHWRDLNLPNDASIFVPLCGKSLDMCFLAEQGHQVIGCELNQQGVEQFFLDNNLPMQTSSHGTHPCYATEQLAIYQGDIFTLSEEVTRECSGFYDRAALIAWPESMRHAYVKKLAALLPSGSQGMLITLDFETDVISGPPFAVSELWVNQHLSEFFEIQQLACIDVLADNPRFLNKQATWLNEVIYRLVRK
ncbi:thiopurine S-methyltransferase [Shewanella gelidii]|uniref:Thiopurine S-methyltransferase n=1 Tax=Shewanella gelidii TaxID=1642821 RepID=A0A917JPH5_9GAMM|nr:thiopurine S-methyltransferase [Shewanella gelidii]MCL1097832.1 thiopurine S-methyltransferase [Shewanella gelidii]GGI78377.1 thiopurine S-methyltransferase [Shewanella gelidii]